MINNISLFSLLLLHFISIIVLLLFNNIDLLYIQII